MTFTKGTPFQQSIWPYRWSINDHLEFNKSYKGIYPSGQELKKESVLISEASFLDYSITI